MGIVKNTFLFIPTSCTMREVLCRLWQLDFLNKEVFRAIGVIYNTTIGHSPLFPKPSPIGRLTPYSGTVSVINTYYNRNGLWLEQVEVDGVMTDVWNRWLSQVIDPELGTFVPTSEKTESAINNTASIWPFVLRYIGRAVK